MIAISQPDAILINGVSHRTDPTSLTRQLEDFLRDPIGYGSYDFDDPITLAEFATTKHYHRNYAATLS